MSICNFSFISDLKVCQRRNAPSLTVLVAKVGMDAKMARFAVHVHLAKGVICVFQVLIVHVLIGQFQKSATRTRTRLKILVINYTLELSN